MHVIWFGIIFAVCNTQTVLRHKNMLKWHTQSQLQWLASTPVSRQINEHHWIDGQQSAVWSRMRSTPYNYSLPLQTYYTIFMYVVKIFKLVEGAWCCTANLLLLGFLANHCSGRPVCLVEYSHLIPILIMPPGLPIQLHLVITKWSTVVLYLLPLDPANCSNGLILYAHKWVWQRWRTAGYRKAINIIQFPNHHHTHPTLI